MMPPPNTNNGSQGKKKKKKRKQGGVPPSASKKQKNTHKNAAAQKTTTATPIQPGVSLLGATGRIGKAETVLRRTSATGHVTVASSTTARRITNKQKYVTAVASQATQAVPLHARTSGPLCQKAKLLNKKTKKAVGMGIGGENNNSIKNKKKKSAAARMPSNAHDDDQQSQSTGSQSRASDVSPLAKKGKPKEKQQGNKQPSVSPHSDANRNLYNDDEVEEDDDKKMPAIPRHADQRSHYAQEKEEDDDDGDDEDYEDDGEEEKEDEEDNSQQQLIEEIVNNLFEIGAKNNGRIKNSIKKERRAFWERRCGLSKNIFLRHIWSPACRLFQEVIGTPTDSSQEATTEPSGQQEKEEEAEFGDNDQQHNSTDREELAQQIVADLVEEGEKHDGGGIPKKYREQRKKYYRRESELSNQEFNHIWKAAMKYIREMYSGADEDASEPGHGTTDAAHEQHPDNDLAIAPPPHDGSGALLEGPACAKAAHDDNNSGFAHEQQSDNNPAISNAPSEEQPSTSHDTGVNMNALVHNITNDLVQKVEVLDEAALDEGEVVATIIRECRRYWKSTVKMRKRDFKPIFDAALTNLEARCNLDIISDSAPVAAAADECNIAPATDTNNTCSPVAARAKNIARIKSQGGFTTQGLDFPFPTDKDDHCESPRQAYAHIQPFLLDLQSRLNSGTNKRQLHIYDPYYCNGAVVDNLNALGFPNVHNKKEDCYQVWTADDRYPDFDVLVTNPPYSGNHMERLLEHITSPGSRFARRPWFLLLPDWVHKKDYFLKLTKDHRMHPLYLVPKKRYVYLPPKQFRPSKKSDTHKKSSPFPSMWYLWCGECQEGWLRQFFSKQSLQYPVGLDNDNVNDDCKNDSTCNPHHHHKPPAPLTRPLSEACDMARSKSALRDLRRKVKKIRIPTTTDTASTEPWDAGKTQIGTTAMNDCDPPVAEGDNNGRTINNGTDDYRSLAEVDANMAAAEDNNTSVPPAHEQQVQTEAAPEAAVPEDESVGTEEEAPAVTTWDHLYPGSKSFNRSGFQFNSWDSVTRIGW